MTSNKPIAFDPSALCSRKLWQLLNDEPAPGLEPLDEHPLIRELVERRHYLAELAKIGKLEQTN